MTDDGVRHGFYSSYSNNQCRCQDCRDAWARYSRDARRRRAFRTPFSLIPHGTNGYGNYLCRCDTCTQAWLAARREQERRRKEAERAGA